MLQLHYLVFALFFGQILWSFALIWGSKFLALIQWLRLSGH